MHLSFEWNQIGWFTLPIKWHPFGHEAIGHEATKVSRWDQGAASVSVSYIDYLKRLQGDQQYMKMNIWWFKKKARLGPSDLKNSKVYINFSNNNSTRALSQHTLTVAH